MSQNRVDLVEFVASSLQTQGEKSMLMDGGDRCLYRLVQDDGTVLKCAVFKEQSIKCIASPNITVIRPNKNVLSAEYLKVFFDSKPGSIALDALKQGEIIVAISYQELKNLKNVLNPLKNS